jgi:hypothetical protein
VQARLARPEAQAQHAVDPSDLIEAVVPALDLVRYHHRPHPARRGQEEGQADDSA